MKKICALVLVLILLATIPLTACSWHKNKLPVDPYDQPVPTNPVSANSTAYLDKISFDPASARYFSNVKETLSLSSDELALLQQNGFVVTDRLAWDRFLDSYAWIYWKDLPVLITTDSLLHSVHQSYDDILKDVEREVLIPQLKTLLWQTQEQVIEARSANNDPQIDPLYSGVSTYLAVALSLLNGQLPSATPAQDLYALATKAEEFKDITLFGNQRTIDFTLFKPRGHYVNEIDLEQYFRSMSWLAQIDFRFVEFDALTSQPILRPNQIVAATILRGAVDSAAQRNNWEEIDHLLESLVGGSDNVTLDGLDKFMADMGFASPSDATRGDTKKMLTALLNNDYVFQRITGQLLARDPSNFSPEPVPRPVSFMLMGQRFAIDSYVLGNLVYDRMIKDKDPILRALPSTLDIMYSLGNDRALTHLADEIEKYGYQQHLAAMRNEVDSLPPDFWTDPVYNRWLGMIRTLNQPTTGEQFPQSLRTSAWADKMLQTQLASWTQLRHDNILYVKQSVTMMVACEYPEGYVEPYPEFYQALYDYAQAGHEVLSGLSQTGNWSYIQEKALKYFSNVMSAARQLKNLADKELALQEFSAEEENFLKSVVVRHENETRMCGGPPYVWDGWYAGLFYNEDKSPALIADVHTNPNKDGPLAPARVLHAATGEVLPICLVAETDEGSTLYVGPSFSYYDVIETGYPPTRLTDQQWQARLGSSKRPAHPDWTQSFLSSGGQLPQILKQE
jgi:hypothetical protein